MGKMKAAAAAADDVSADFIVPDLTPQQKEARGKGLGGSDAERIMSGDWYALWAEKTRRVQTEDLSRVLPVQMGKVTEAFNAHWFGVQTGLRVNRSPSVVQRTHVHPAYPHMLCDIDGLPSRRRITPPRHPSRPLGIAARGSSRPGKPYRCNYSVTTRNEIAYITGARRRRPPSASFFASYVDHFNPRHQPFP